MLICVRERLPACQSVHHTAARTHVKARQHNSRTTARCLAKAPWYTAAWTRSGHAATDCVPYQQLERQRLQKLIEDGVDEDGIDIGMPGAGSPAGMLLALRGASIAMPGLRTLSVSVIAAC